MVVHEFNDRNNLTFRREILGRNVDLAKLSKTKEEELKCEKTKGEELIKRQQLVRESEKDPFGTNKSPVVEEGQVSYNVLSMSSFHSGMDVETPKESQRKIMLRKKRERRAACLARYKKMKGLIGREIKQHEKRVEDLKERYKNSSFFMELLKKMEI